MRRPARSCRVEDRSCRVDDRGPDSEACAGVRMMVDADPGVNPGTARAVVRGFIALWIWAIGRPGAPELQGEYTQEEHMHNVRSSAQRRFGGATSYLGYSPEYQTPKCGDRRLHSLV